MWLLFIYTAIVSSVIGEGYFVIADTPEATVLSEPNNEIVTMTVR